ncbi:hypothetical protein ACS0TY_024397 [Phlomoides rotata]
MIKNCKQEFKNMAATHCARLKLLEMRLDAREVSHQKMMDKLDLIREKLDQLLRRKKKRSSSSSSKPKVEFEKGIEPWNFYFGDPFDMWGIADETELDEGCFQIVVELKSWEEEESALEIPEMVLLTGSGWEETDAEGIDFKKMDQERIEADFKRISFGIKFHDVQGKNYRCVVPKLNKESVPKECELVVKPKRVIVTLVKASKGSWLDLHYKEDKLKPNLDKKQDLIAGIMDLMKNMYKESDEDMKRIVMRPPQVWIPTPRTAATVAPIIVYGVHSVIYVMIKLLLAGKYVFYRGKLVSTRFARYGVDLEDKVEFKGEE